MSDLISRTQAIDAMANTLWHYPGECYRNLNTYEFAKGLAELGLKSVPSAQPEIVRCKDCEYCVPGYITDSDDFIPPRCGRLRQTMRISGDDYCSFGERRTDGSY